MKEVTLEDLKGCLSSDGKEILFIGPRHVRWAIAQIDAHQPPNCFVCGKVVNAKKSWQVGPTAGKTLLTDEELADWSTDKKYRDLCDECHTERTTDA